MLRHDALLAGLYEALDGDRSPPANAIRAVLLVHISHPPIGEGPQQDCGTCVGTGTGLVDGRWVHCCCGCPICSCGAMVCDEGCETVEVLAEELGVVVAEPVGGAT